jgi:hypothetical protein
MLLLLQLKLTSRVQESPILHRLAVQNTNILAGLIPSQTSTMFVDDRLYRFYNTLSAFSEGLPLRKLRK